MSSEGQKPPGKGTLRALGLVNTIDKMASRVTFPFLKRLAARRGVEMYRVSSLGEQQELASKLEPLLTNAIDIKIAEGDFSEGLLSEREWPPDTRIKVTKMPEGSAPERVRRKWLGVKMNAYKLPSSSEELDLASGDPLPERKTEHIYAVKLEEALQSLEIESPQAASWFRNNVPPDIDTLTFKSDEIKTFRR